jgi:hypothetical protein
MGYRVAGPEYDEHLEELRLLAELARADGLEPVLFFFDAGLTRESATESSESEGPPAPDAERRRNIRQMRSLGAYRLLHAPLDARASALGFHVVDTYAAAQELIRARGWDSLRPLWLSKEDNHPNAEGHAFLARILYEALTTTAPYRELFTLAEPPK